MTRYDDWKTTISGSQLVLGLVLFLTPWLIGFAAEQTPAWTAWVSGGLIALAGIAALLGQAYAAAWVNLALGLWAIVAPWVLGFGAMAGAMWSHVVLGALVALAAGAELWMGHQSPPRVHA
jgi:SPW repeat-containing protein